jgi:hypothetical protein
MSQEVAVPDPSGPRSPSYPATFEIAYPPELNHWLPLVKWLLAYWLTGVLTVVAFFTVLFTKRIPREVFELMVPGMRWNLRGEAYSCFMTERYPPFVWG